MRASHSSGWFFFLFLRAIVVFPALSLLLFSQLVFVVRLGLCRIGVGSLLALGYVLKSL